jgi:3-phosphoglycerate kinase
MVLRTPSPQDIAGKTVIVRVDYNVPLAKSGDGWQVAEDERLRVSLPTIEFLRENGAKIILMSHLGRPDGKKEARYSLQPVADRLGELLRQPVAISPDCIGSETDRLAKNLDPGQVLLLENLRFHPEEEANDARFAKQLASLADIYLNEAFSTCHRKHASIVAITKHLPSFAGLNCAKEVEMLSSLMAEPKRPFVMVVGGAKIADKVGAICHLAKIADAVLVGGGVANNFLKADGVEICNSYIQDDPVDKKQKGRSYVTVAEDLIRTNKNNKLLLHGYVPLPKIIYPIDVVAAPSLESKRTEILTLTNGAFDRAEKEKLMYLDIGPKTRRLYREILLEAETIFWNGPMGVFENPSFRSGTLEIARTIAKAGGTTILGGGDTIAAINEFKLQDRYDYVSAAGGAALEFLSGNILVGLKPLLD